MGSIGPSYQPGHAHADELNFELFYKGSPIIVDTGVSTYEKNERRLREDLNSHNVLFWAITQVTFGQDLGLGREQMSKSVWITTNS